MPSTQASRRVRQLLTEYGTTYAEDAGIRLSDKPAPLYQLLVLVQLLSKPIGSELAVAGTRELLTAGWRTPEKMRSATWQERVDALGRGHYRRYDESTSTLLEDGAVWLLDTYRGDLRGLADEAHGRIDRADALLQQAPGLGPTGAAIYLREVQAVWAWVRPYADERVRTVARSLGIPHSPRGLANLAGSTDLAHLGAALIRSST